MTTFVVFLLIFIGLALFQVPIAFSLGISTIYMMAVLPVKVPIEVIAQRIFAGSNIYILLAIPLFILAGNLMSYGGMSRRMVGVVNWLVGRITGGLSLVMIGTCMLFAGVSGSAVADCAAVGGVMLPMMEEKKYPKAWTAGLLSTAGTIGPIIPPSIPMLTYAIVSGTSVIKLFLGGIIPGIMIGGGLMLVAYFQSRKRGFAKGEKVSFKEGIKTFKSSILAIGTPIIIMGGILGGICTPTEAGAIACAYGFIVGAFVYKEIKLKHLSFILHKTIISTSIVVFLICVSIFSAWLITVYRVPNALVTFFRLFSHNIFLTFLVINIFLLIWGTIMDLAPTVLILTPLLMPLIEELGIDPAFFGVMMIINLCIGLVTPPVGTVLYVVVSMTKVKPLDLFRESLPFLLIMVCTLILIVLFPELVLFIPNKLL